MDESMHDWYIEVVDKGYPHTENPWSIKPCSACKMSVIRTSAIDEYFVVMVPRVI